MLSPTNPPQVGDGMTLHIGSDAEAHTVREVSKSGKTIWLSRDKATRTNKEDDVFVPGGFMGHTESPKGQAWQYETVDVGPWHKVTWREKIGRYVLAGVPTRQRGWYASEGRNEFYDYNF
jgi:hypothetical protein